MENPIKIHDLGVPLFLETGLAVRSAKVFNYTVILHFAKKKICEQCTNWLVVCR